MKLSTLRTYINNLIDCSGYSQLPEMAHHYGNHRMIGELIIREQDMEGSQTNISSFFGPRRSFQDSVSASHFPSLLGTPPALED